MPRFSNRPFLATTLSFFVIRRAADLSRLAVEGSAVRYSCAPLLPAHNLHQSSPNPHGNPNRPFVIPGFQEWSAEPQIPRLRSPGFPVEIGGVGELHAPFLTRKGAHATVSSAAWQEIRVGMTKRRGSLQGKGGC